MNKQQTIDKMLDIYTIFKRDLETSKEDDENTEEISKIAFEYLETLLTDINKFEYEEFVGIVEADFIDSLENIEYSLEAGKISKDFASEQQILAKSSTISYISATFLLEWDYDIEEHIKNNFDNPSKAISLWRRVRDRLF